MRLRDRIVRSPEPDSVLLSTYAGDYALGDLDRETERYKSLLGNESLVGMKIGILVPAVTSYLPLVLAVYELGGIVMPLSWQFRSNDLKAVLAFLDPHIVFTTEAHNGFPFSGVIEEWANGTGKATTVFVSTDSRSWRKTRFGGEARPLEPEHADFICCSSGSTGTPKGLMVSADALEPSARMIADFNGLKPSDRVFVNAPANSVFGLAVLFGAIRSGARVVFPDDFDLPKLVSFMDETQCNKVITTPSVFKAIYAFAASMKPAVTRRLEQVSLSGELVDGSYVGAFDALDRCRFISLYGSSEIGGAMHCDLRGASAFAVVPGVEFKLNEGELMLKSPAAFTGYYRNAELTRESFDLDGWFHSGDLARLDDAGRIEIVGRKKDMIKKGGQQVIPAEIENELHLHPGVKRAVVIGAPHPVYGEQIVAFVVPEDHLDIEQLYPFCASRLAGYKVPDLIRPIAELPAVQGKVDKLALRNLIRS